MLIWPPASPVSICKSGMALAAPAKEDCSIDALERQAIRTLNAISSREGARDRQERVLDHVQCLRRLSVRLFLCDLQALVRESDINAIDEGQTP